MKRMQMWRWLPAAVLLAAGGTAARAGDLAIQSFNGTGRLSFGELPDATSYRVEWAPAPNGPWTNFPGAVATLHNIPATGMGSVTCSVPMCYRVVACLIPATPTSFALAGGAATTTVATITLSHTYTGRPVFYLASENADFAGASWQAWTATPTFALSPGDGVKTVYFKVKNAANEESSVVSDTISYVEPIPLSIAQQPQSVTNYVGSNVTFSVTASGTAPVTYQWRLYGTNLAGAVSSNLTLANIQTTDAGKYTVVITNAYGSVTSAVAVLTVLTNAQTPPGTPFGMVLIPAGVNSGTDPDFGAYSLTVNAFYMDSNLVTKAQWDAVYTWALTNGYTFAHTGSGKAANHPVHTVSWHDCVKWCNARSEKEGRPVSYRVDGAVYRGADNNSVICSVNVAGYRLPTDVEYEYASRGGLKGKRFPWGDTIQHSQANYYSSSSYSYDTSPTRGYHPTYNDGVYPDTSPVGSFPANEYGLYDMVGNVWEWCTDWYPGYEGSRRVYRGGSWYNGANGCRSAYHYYVLPANAYYYVGFRAALPPGQ